MNNIESTQTAAAQEFQRIARGNIRLLVAFYKPKQEILAAALKIKQPSLSRKLNGKADWMPADIANVADFFGILKDAGKVVDGDKIVILSSAQGDHQPGRTDSIYVHTVGACD